MAVISNLVAKFTADHVSFDRGTERARKSLHNFSSSAATTQRAIRNLAGAFVAAAGIGGIGYMLKKQAEIIDSTAKLADRLGMGTEALVGLQHGAQISGVEISTMNKSLETFTRRIGEVMGGTGEAKRAMDQLRLSVDDLIGVPAEEAFARVAERIKGLTTQSEKAAAANWLFGRSGQELLNLFEEGKAGIERYREEAEKLGLTFSRIDARQVEEANDAMTRLRAIFTGIARQVTIELSPYVELAAKQFTDWATAGEGLGAKVTDAFEGISKAAVGLSNIFDDLQADLLDMRASAAEFYRVWQFIAPLKGGPVLGPYVTKDLAEGLRQQAEALRKGGEDRLNAVEKFYENLRRERSAQPTDRPFSQYEIDVMLGKQGPAPAFVGPPVPDLEAQQKAIENLKNQVTSSTVDIAAAYARMYGEIDGLSKESYEAKRQLIEAEYNKYKKIIEDEVALEKWKQEQIIKLKMEEPQNVFEGMAAGVERFKRELGSMGQLVDKITYESLSGMTDALTDAVFEAKDLSDAMRDIARSIGKELMRFGIGNALAGIGGALFPMPLMHSGGTVGMTAFPKRFVSPAVFAEAPRLHGGLRNDEFPAILQVGEKVTSRAEVSRGRSDANLAEVKGLLIQIHEDLQRRQTINAKIVDHRDVVTAGQIEGRQGQQWVMNHVERNGR